MAEKMEDAIIRRHIDKALDMLVLRFDSWKYILCIIIYKIHERYIWISNIDRRIP